MLKPHPLQRFVLTFVVAVVALAIAGAAAADTIYLKNGRTIRSSYVRVVGDRVVFIQYGGQVALPMSLVDRIEEDTNVGPSSSPAPPPSSSSDDTSVGSADPDDPEAATAEEEVPEEETRAYWQDRVRSIEAEKEQLRLQIEDLRRTERAFLFSHRSTADTRAAIEQAEQRLTELDEEMAALRQEARQAGVPAGWLRLSPGGGGGQGGGGSSGG